MTKKTRKIIKFRKPEPKVENDAQVCPFCGWQPCIEFWHGGGPQKRMIRCDNEFCTVAPHVTGETRRQALKLWNTRA